MDLLEGKKLLKEFNIPAMMHKNKLMTQNNFATVHWATKSKIKNEYKKLLSDWFLDHEPLPEKCHFIWQPTYKDARRRDSINTSAMAKVCEDTIVEIGSLPDDNKTSHTLLPGIIDKEANQHMINLKIFG